MVPTLQSQQRTTRSAREAPETDGEIRFTAHSAPKIGSFVQVKITAAGTYDLRGEEVCVPF